MLTLDRRAWQAGYDAGKRRQDAGSCPFPVASREAFAWSSGYIEGKAAEAAEGSLEDGEARSRAERRRLERIARKL